MKQGLLDLAWFFEKIWMIQGNFWQMAQNGKSDLQGPYPSAIALFFSRKACLRALAVL